MLYWVAYRMPPAPGFPRSGRWRVFMTYNRNKAKSSAYTIIKTLRDGEQFRCSI